MIGITRALLGLATARLCWVLYSYYALGQAQRYHLETAWFIFIAAAVLLAATRPSIHFQGDDASSSSRATVLPLALCLAAALALYAPALGVGLLSDDYVLLANSPLHSQWEFFRPLPLAVWAVVYPLFGDTILHLVNVALHGVNGWLLFRLLTQVIPCASSAIATASTALFIAHPAVVEAIAWNAGVFDVVLVTAALTYLSALAARHAFSRVIALPALVVALLSKESAVAVPVLGLLLMLRGLTRDRTVLAISFGLCGAYAAVRMLTQDAPEIEGSVRYFLKEMIVRPYATLGNPWTEGEIAARPLLLGLAPQIAFAAIVVSYAASGTVRTWPLLSGLWILAGAAPLLGYLYVGPHLEGGRYIYLPLVGWCVLLSELVQRQRYPMVQRALTLVLIGLAIAGTFGVRQHLAAWQQAAVVRDQVLASAGEVLKGTECPRVALTDVPDSLRGAYVFRNGLVEAVSRHVGATVTQSAPPSCTFRWTGDGFRRATNGQ